MEWYVAKKQLWVKTLGGNKFATPICHLYLILKNIPFWKIIFKSGKYTYLIGWINQEIWKEKNLSCWMIFCWWHTCQFDDNFQVYGLSLGMSRSKTSHVTLLHMFFYEKNWRFSSHIRVFSSVIIPSSKTHKCSVNKMSSQKEQTNTT